MNDFASPPPLTPINASEAQQLMGMLAGTQVKFTYSLGDFTHLQQLLARSLMLVATGQAELKLKE